MLQICFCRFKIPIKNKRITIYYYLVAMAEKITFRADEELIDWLDDYVEDTEYSKSDLMRSHLENMKNNELYREFHEVYMDDEKELLEFIESRDEFEDAWVNMEKVDYEEMFGRFKSVVQSAERGSFDEAYDMIDDMADEGFEREEILLNSVVSQYRD